MRTPDGDPRPSCNENDDAWDVEREVEPNDELCPEHESGDEDGD